MIFLKVPKHTESLTYDRKYQNIMFQNHHFSSTGYAVNSEARSRSGKLVGRNFLEGNWTPGHCLGAQTKGPSSTLQKIEPSFWGLRILLKLARIDERHAQWPWNVVPHDVRDVVSNPKKKSSRTRSLANGPPVSPSMSKGRSLMVTKRRSLMAKEGQRIIVTEGQIITFLKYLFHLIC